MTKKCYKETFLLGVMILVSCSKGMSYDYNVVNTDAESQEKISCSLKQSNHIESFEKYDKKVDIKFSDGEAYRIMTDEIPLFTIGDNSDWFINNKDTKILLDDYFPSVNVIDDFWYIDGHKTNITAPKCSEKSRIICLVSHGSVVKFYYNDGTCQKSCLKNSIILFNPEDEYSDLIYNLRESDNLEKKHPLVLCHLSDIHGDKDNLSRAIEFCDYYNCVDDILCSGDLVKGSFNEDSYDYWDVVGAHNVLTCIGNHDTNYYDGKSNDFTYYAGKQAYDRYFKPYIDTWNVSQPSNSSVLGLCYYYKDYDFSGIRLIVLDCMKFDSRQELWLKATLDDAKKKGLSVVCVSHYPLCERTPFETTFTFYEFVESGLITCSTPIDEAIKAVDDFIERGGDFICWLGGHIHRDTVGYISGHNNQIIITVESSSCDENQTMYAYTDRIKNTKSQDSFNLVSFDAENGFIKLLRIGNSLDNYSREKKTICIDYRHAILEMN